ncbi:permease-like cell division protein FtsX [Marinimicrobium sp. ABcell2]|uniref:permease-like cell division protein FtsX n=1 Tax=Marinimicrobium sp. ABcell2 TaxID=3069751 RepID=UPI0027B09D1E|nr:permease-like cell division protein FtsX [Marinimicrobium sp. ABcell2]MDQ2076669.1 permease-like cell division protein FtsX [Marinimicrobium sp. ABcell2]
MNPRRPSERASSPARKGGRVPQGASQSRAKVSDRLDSWVGHHSTTAAESLARLLRTPLQSLLTWLVVAVAVALPAALYVALSNVQNLGYSWQESSQLSVFVQRDARPDAISALQTRILERPDVLSVEHIPPDAALEEFKRYSGLGRVVEGLERNPLPDVLLVFPAEAGITPEGLEALQQELESEALIAEARVDMAWVTRLQQLMRLGQRLVLALAGLLALGVLLAIGNTIRLAIENRRDEILVVKLVGGTDAFVRRPFLYTGLWYGMGGGLLALLLVGLGLWWLSGPVAHLADLYQSQFRLQGLGWTHSVQLVLLSGLLGLLGSWLAVARHLSAIEPR